MQYYTEYDLVSGPTRCLILRTEHIVFLTLEGGFATVKVGPLLRTASFIIVGS
jgi:hypothetical protein